MRQTTLVLAGVGDQARCGIQYLLPPPGPSCSSPPVTKQRCEPVSPVTRWPVSDGLVSADKARRNTYYVLQTLLACLPRLTSDAIVTPNSPTWSLAVIAPSSSWWDGSQLLSTKWNRRKLLLTLIVRCVYNTCGMTPKSKNRWASFFSHLRYWYRSTLSIISYL